MLNNSNRVTESKAGIFSRTAASFGLKKKKTGFEVVERGNTTGLYAMIDTYKRQIPKLQEIKYACNTEIENIEKAKNMEDLTKALKEFQKSLGETIDVTISPKNETTNEIMKSAFLIAKDKVRAYAKNNNVVKNTDLASLTKMQRNMTLRENLTANEKEKAKEKAKAKANANAIINNASLLNANEKANEKEKANATQSVNQFEMFISEEPKEKRGNFTKNLTELGGGAKVRRKKATTAMKKKKATTAMKKKKATTAMKKKKATTTAMKKKKATTTAMKKKKATGTKKKATKK